MDLKTIGAKLKTFMYKNRYAALVLLIGIILMCLPSKRGEAPQIQTTEVEEKSSVSHELAEILSNIDGAGKVEVLLSVASGEETIYQTNQSVSESETGSATQCDTVTVTDEQRNQTGLIRQINPPTYQGAIIVSQGADKPTVRLAIVNAVSKVTGLTTDRISVLKMK